MKWIKILFICVCALISVNTEAQVLIKGNECTEIEVSDLAMARILEFAVERHVITKKQWQIFQEHPSLFKCAHSDIYNCDAVLFDLVYFLEYTTSHNIYTENKAMKVFFKMLNRASQDIVFIRISMVVLKTM